MLKLQKKACDQILACVKQSYPYECCGVLVGRINGEVKEALGAYPIENLNKERAADRYNMDPIGFMRVEKEIARQGLEMVGIYHSHPDHPAKPSQTDFQHAWPVYSYLIFAIAKGTDIEAKNWCLNEDGSAFIEEQFEISSITKIKNQNAK
ncbi:MAG: M67 family metallopeptidase [Chlamydiae bacterium]|nr:M67 family metallopeptidase [Chlamydiota bacterium]MBI3277511.1 M67 family metallopeptidase [Chlamydiota bacterium]